MNTLTTMTATRPRANQSTTPNRLSLPTRTINRTTIKTVRLGTDTQATEKTTRLLKRRIARLIQIRPNDTTTMLNRHELLREIVLQFSPTHHHRRMFKFVIPIVKLIH